MYLYLYTPLNNYIIISSVSMPGMMDTILNLGLNDAIVEELIKTTNNPRFAYDVQRRFLAMFGNVVMGIKKESYDDILQDVRKKKGLNSDQDLSISDLQLIVSLFKQIAMPPDDPSEQLRMAIEAVFNSWYTPRAISYREINGIKHSLGTAVCVQSMVYGNLNTKSGSGVLFSRDPVTGDNNPYGEYLVMSEGEDVVSGSHTPLKLDDMKRETPSIYNKLIDVKVNLEKHYRDMQDIEFTVENNELYILQTRRGKRTPPADVKIAVSMVEEGLINQREALCRINANQMDFFLHPMIGRIKLHTNLYTYSQSQLYIDPAIKSTGLPGIQSLVIAKGLAASPGAACGVICFSNIKAKELAKVSRYSITNLPITNIILHF